MPVSPATASTGRIAARATKAMALLVVAIACLSGCGKSQAEKDAEQAAEDARYDAAATAEQERESKETAKIEAEPVVLADTKTSRSATAPHNVAAAEGQSGTASATGDAASETPDDLRKLYSQMMGNVRSNLPHDDSVHFYETYLNKSHMAVCGSVDYEIQADGVPTRSRRQRFIGFVNDAVVDTDAPGVHETFERMAGGVDCSPDLYNFSSYSQ